MTRQKNPEKLCPNCGQVVPSRNKYCNSQCKADYEYKQYIKRWQQGEETGTKGAQEVSGHVRRYLFEKYNCSCQECGWNKINEFTQKVPLQIHHLNGDCKDNRESNLKLLCPNCHSLTENFGSRNTSCTRVDLRNRS